MTGVEARAWKGFLEQTGEHKLEILHNDGLYRHIRMAKPGTRMWSWDIITWPGTLAIRGDIGDGFMFSRVEDMFQFFRSGKAPDGIDFRYWAEKLSHNTRSVKVFSNDAFITYVNEQLEDTELEPARKAELLESARDMHAVHENEAYEWMRDNSEDFGYDFYDGDAPIREWDFQFLLACYAIAAAIEAWDAK